MIRALVLTGGEAPDGTIIRKHAEKCDLIIAADSGFDIALQNGIEPDVVLGDMDSMKNISELGRIPKEKIIKYPRDKDETDTELAIALARKKGADYITLLGGGGGRMDHFIGILSLFERDDGPDEWYTDRERLITIRDIFILNNMKGRRISLFPVGREQCTMASEGLKWPLDTLVWNKGDTGISNEINETRMKITMKTGRLIMICDIEPGVE